jgi:radical SAM protein with 4Fe4S-binding SPASM domain
VSDILSERLAADPRGEEGLVGALVEMVDLAGRGLLLLEPAPQPVPLRLTGDPFLYYPLNLQVELTAACNLRCSYCYREAGADPAEETMATDELLGILERLWQHGLQSVEITGGEPLLHKDLVRILRFCGERFALVALLTNGTGLTEEIVEAMLPLRDKLIVSVSLDGSTPEGHDRRRGLTGAFARTGAGVRRLAERGFLTRVSMVVDESNWGDIEPTLLLARSLGATLFTYTPLLPIGRGRGQFRRWTGHDPLALFQQEEALRARYAGFLHALPEESVFDLQDAGGCGAGYRTYALDPAGRVRPCVTFEPHVAVFGSLRTDPLHALFGSPLAHAFAAVTPPQPEVCGQCAFRLFCQNCLVRGLIASEWLPAGECAWLRQPATSHWAALVRQHTVAAGEARH